MEISLISNKGEGYKTSWNTIITVLFLCAVAWFIIFAGLFELSPNYTIETIPLLQDDTIYPKAVLNPEDIIFRINKTITANYNLSLVLIDKYNSIIDTPVLLSGAACYNYVIGLNDTTAGNWMCLNSSITLMNNGINTKVKLGFRLVYRGAAFGVSTI